jgi:hypothetical protein
LEEVVHLVPAQRGHVSALRTSTFTCSGVLFEFALTALVSCFTFTFTSVASTATTTDDKQDAEVRVGGSTQIIRV